jgi:hypothetical protein
VQTIPAEDSQPLARVLFDFSATSEFELNVLGNDRPPPPHINAHVSTSEGTLVHVHEEEDGTGWVKVADNLGRKGLVPASYIHRVGSADSQTLNKVPQRQQWGEFGSFDTPRIG